MDYRISFSPNCLEPFTWKVDSFKEALEYANKLSDFDLGAWFPELEQSGINRMIAAFKAYRRKWGINHSSLIWMSICTIDRYNKRQNRWFIASENISEDAIEEPEDYLEAFN